MSQINKYKKGVAMETGLLALMVVSAVLAASMVVIRLHDESRMRRIENASQKNIASNAMSVLTLFYRENINIYFQWLRAIVNDPAKLASCTNPANFSQLGQGHDCTNNEIFELFKPTTGPFADPNTEGSGFRNIYSYATPEMEDRGYCKIEKEGSDCADSAGNRLVATVGFNNEAQRVLGYKFKFYFSGFGYPDKTNFLVEVFSSNGKTFKFSASFSENLKAIYAEGDSKLSADFADSEAPCKVDKFAEILYLDTVSRTCKTIPKVGSLQGVAGYKGRTFGYRPEEGIVFDLGSSAGFSSKKFASFKAGDSALITAEGGAGALGVPLTMTAQVFTPFPTSPTFGTIAENGTLECDTGVPCPSEAIFPPYRRTIFKGSFADIEVVPTRDKGQIIVLGSGSRPGIFVFNPEETNPNKALIEICNLANQNFMQELDSLVIDPASNPLVLSAADKAKETDYKAFFKLIRAEVKTTAGAVYWVSIFQSIQNGHLTFENSNEKDRLICVVNGNNSKDDIEYRRLGAGTSVGDQTTSSMGF